MRSMDPPMVLPLPRSTDAATPEPLVFDSVYARHFRAIWRTLRRLGVRDAQLDDAAQDVFIVVYRKLAEFDGRSLRGWLYAIALRVASDYRRDAARRSSLALGDLVADAALGPARITERNESIALLHTLLDQLDVAKRTVFVLGELEQLSAPEIAEALGVNLNTVYARLRAARIQFDAALTRHRLRTERSAP
jgi:RNA polymerase sigma-70 factor, ECF subfamily